METVWIVRGNWTYEGFETVGICATEEAAQRVAKDAEARKGDFETPSYDWVDIEEVQVIQ